MKRRKICALLLTAAMAASVLGGCGGKSEPAASTDSSSTEAAATETAGADSAAATESTESAEKADSAAASGEVIELTFYNADGQEDPWTDPVAQAITEATGIKLKTEYPVSQDDETIALMIAEQDYPDMIFAKGDAGSLIEAGALIDMTDLIEEYGPNIKKLYGEELDKLKYSADDPSIYQLSSYNVGGNVFTSSGTAQVQWDVLKANDYKVPNSLAEFETMIKDYLAANPTTEDGLDRIGFTLSTSDWHWMITLGNPAGFIADAAPDNGQWLVDENNQGVYKFRSENEREYFRWMCRMYNEGILDPEFATQTHEDYIAKIASGRVVALFDAEWDYADGEKVLKADGKYGSTYAGLPLTMYEDQKSAALMYQGLTTGYGIGISTSCEDPVAAIKYLDFICSDEGQVLVQWGIQDVNYFIDEEGHRYRTDEEVKAAAEDKDYGKKTGVGFHNYPFPYYGDGIVDATGSTYTTKSKESVMKDYNDEQKAACEAWGVDLLVDIFPQASEFETPKYSAIWAYAKPMEFDEIANQLDEVAWSGLITCIMGSEADFDANYDAMLEELEATGMAEAEQMLTDIIQEKVSLVE